MSFQLLEEIHVCGKLLSVLKRTIAQMRLNSNISVDSNQETKSADMVQTNTA